MSQDQDLRIGVYVCHCGSNIASVIDPKAVADYAATLPGVVLTNNSLYTCSDSGQRQIQEDIKKHKLNRVV